MTKKTFKTIEDGDDLELHIAYPKGHQSMDKRPAIIFFFGGGWKFGKPGQFYPFIQDLSDEGIVAISAQYRTKKSHGATPVECVMDGKSAIRYVREHAAELGIDPDKIIAGGGSAGGHVAACAVVDNAPQETNENLQISSRPQALVLLNPVLSVGPDGYAHGYVKQSIDNWQSVSPLHSIDSNFPPTLIQVGTADKVLPPSMAYDFEKQMKAAGNKCEIIFYEGAAHGFFNKPEYRDQITNKIKAFLQSLGYIN
ncbi:alpha/beta hydrolase [Rubellicoccus peritrichatus]|uniref:Alpha/beta hydrolase n=1 Tax=Rubellicoccus peritrichatus TaxID=3080537 RepID=A0AAQ3L8F6_9BACT|nr:alpha/beta hydrolase [Puniceicoccus sp. CR14]WOO41016.1 alpha/beta hydrolase [Puniceicoccus sp. CR14]